MEFPVLHRFVQAAVRLDAHTALENDRIVLALPQ